MNGLVHGEKQRDPMEMAAAARDDENVFIDSEKHAASSTHHVRQNQLVSGQLLLPLSSLKLQKQLQ